MPTLSPLSLVTAPVDVLCATGQAISRATAFFYKRDQNWIYLVTNWHVATGRDPLSPRSTKTGAIPTALRLKLHKNIGDNHISRSQKIPMKVDINDEQGENPRWLEHPVHRHRVDVVAIRIKNDGQLAKAAAFEFLDEARTLHSAFFPSVMDDAFVIGYPWALTGGDSVLPLYKRGSVASEPIVDYGGLPRFLIDCRTSSAMSGSPVICGRSGLWMPNGKMDNDSVIGTVMNFSGVYSGRLKPLDTGTDYSFKDEISDIGIVWTKSALDEIISVGITGSKLSELV